MATGKEGRTSTSGVAGVGIDEGIRSENERREESRCSSSRSSVDELPCHRTCGAAAVASSSSDDPHTSHYSLLLFLPARRPPGGGTLTAAASADSAPPLQERLQLDRALV